MIIFQRCTVLSICIYANSLPSRQQIRGEGIPEPAPLVQLHITPFKQQHRFLNFPAYHRSPDTFHNFDKLPHFITLSLFKLPKLSGVHEIFLLAVAKPSASMISGNEIANLCKPQLVDYIADLNWSVLCSRFDFDERRMRNFVSTFEDPKSRCSIAFALLRCSQLDFLQRRGQRVHINGSGAGTRTHCPDIGNII